MLDDFCDNAFEAMSSANLEFRVALAESFVEEASIDEHSVDVVTVAQGLHWFDTDAFFRQCQLALKPTGILAVWGYGSWWYPDNAAANHAMKVSRCWVTKGARETAPGAASRGVGIVLVESNSPHRKPLCRFETSRALLWRIDILYRYTTANAEHASLHWLCVDVVRLSDIQSKERQCQRSA